MRFPTAVTLRLGAITLVFGPGWLLVAPVALALIALVYVPVVAPALSPVEDWLVAVLIAVLLAVGLIGHVAAHTLIARWARAKLPTRIPIHFFGDAAQVWPAASNARAEALIALAGPATHFSFAILSFGLWEVQWHPWLTASAPLLVELNFSLVFINLAPGFPLDGGRLARVMLWRLPIGVERGNQAAWMIGRGLAGALALWGVYLLVQNARFSLETGIGTLLAAALLFLAARRDANLPDDPSPEPSSVRPLYRTITDGIEGIVVMTILLGLSISVAPTTNGLYAPGDAVPVESMIILNPERRFQPEGQFLLTTVIGQAPITLGQLVVGWLDPTVEIVAAERLVPYDVTPQEVMMRNRQMLDESEIIAAVVALRLAGYAATASSEAVEVIAVIEESPLNGRLHPGDWIVGIDAEAIDSVNSLVAQLGAYTTGDRVIVQAERYGEPLQLETTLLPPGQPGDPPRLGVVIRSVGFRSELPFPVTIEQQKIVGGPSAGLMFTLTIYNLLTPHDLTGGWRIAGTGTIELDGNVGPIGGVQHKIAAAEEAGAGYFLAPPENIADARRAAHTIKVVEVATVEEALAFLQKLAENPNVR